MSPLVVPDSAWKYLCQDTCLQELCLKFAVDDKRKCSKVLLDSCCVLLQRTSSLQKLSLEGTLRSDGDLRTFLEGLKSNTTVQHLDLSFCGLTSAGTRLIKDCGIKLTSFDLEQECNWCSGRC
jgi:hypothetical protein